MQNQVIDLPFVVFHELQFGVGGFQIVAKFGQGDKLVLPLIGGLREQVVALGSSTLSKPRSSSCMIAIEVNCLVIDPKRNFVDGVFGMSHSKLAIP